MIDIKHNTHADTTRLDMTEACVIAAVLIAGFLLLLLPVLGWYGIVDSLRDLGGFALIALVVSYLPFAALAAMKTHALIERHRLATTRSRTERESLNSLLRLDQNKDGKVDEDELGAFITYAKRLHGGFPATAAAAATLGISGPTWQAYRDELLALGAAFSIRRQGGEGFGLTARTMSAPFEQLKAAIVKAHASRPGTPRPR